MAVRPTTGEVGLGAAEMVHTYQKAAGPSTTQASHHQAPGILRLRGGGARTTGASAQSDQTCTVMELRQANDGDTSSRATRIVYSPIAGHEKLMQLTFTMPLQLKRGWLHRAVAADAVVTLQMAAYCEASRTCIKLQRVRAWLQSTKSSGISSVGSHAAASASAALVAHGATLQAITLEVSAEGPPAAQNSSPVVHRFSTINPATPGNRIINSALAGSSCYGVLDTEAFRIESEPSEGDRGSPTLRVVRKQPIAVDNAKSEYVPGSTLALVSMEALSTPMLSGAGACPATLRLKRSVTHLLMAGLQRDQLLGIECGAGTVLVLDDCGPEELAGITVSCKAAATALLLPKKATLVDKEGKLRNAKVEQVKHTASTTICDAAAQLVIEKPEAAASCAEEQTTKGAGKPKGDVLRIRGGSECETEASTQCTEDCCDMELHEPKGSGRADDSNSTSPDLVIYSRTGGNRKLTFKQGFRLKRRWYSIIYQLLHGKPQFWRRSVAAEAVVSVELAACSEAGRTCIKLQHVQAWLQPKSTVEAPADDTSAAANPKQALVTRGGMLRDVTLEFCASTKPTAASSKLLWHRFTSINPATTETRIIDHRPAECDYYGVRETTSVSGTLSPQAGPSGGQAGSVTGTRTWAPTERPSTAAGDELELVWMETSPTPLKYRPGACPATLRLKRNLTKSLMAGLSGEELLGIQCERGTILVLDACGRTQATNILVSCNVGATALMLPGVAKLKGKLLVPRNVHIERKLRDEVTTCFRGVAELTIAEAVAAGPSSAAADAVAGPPSAAGDAVAGPPSAAADAACNGKPATLNTRTRKKRLAIRQVAGRGVHNTRRFIC